MISVLVPYRPDRGHRDAAWAWLSQRWADTMYEIVVQIAEPGADPGDFNHPWAINRAAEKASGDVFIVADADTAFDPRWVQEAADLVAGGTVPWVLPRYYDKLTQEASAALLEGDPLQPINTAYETEWRGDGVSWSGLVVVPREAFVIAGGYDERWVYWGGDDVAFACTMNTLWGQCHRLEGAAMHLWHPRNGLDEQPKDQHDLMYRYLEADGDPYEIGEVRFG